MATIASTLLLENRFGAAINNSTNAVTRMENAIERLNQTGNSRSISQSFAQIYADITPATRALSQLKDELTQTAKCADMVENLDSVFAGLGNAVNAVKKSLQFMQQTWDGIEKLGANADERTAADARLAQINDGLRTQKQLEAQVMRVADSTRMEYASTAALVAQIGQQDYFKGDNDEALAFTETLSQGFMAGGASGVEVQGALTQFAQGLASGSLNGEEFNSMMENGSVLAEMMAASLGVSENQLYEMAENGQLTTEVVVSAIMGQASAIEELFHSMPTLFGQAMNVFDNKISGLINSLSQPGQAVDIIIGKIEELNDWLNTADGAQFMDGLATAATVAAEGIARLMDAAANIYNFFADNWPLLALVLAGIAVAVGIVTAAYLAYKTIMLIQTVTTVIATAAQWALNSAFLACPLTWIVIAALAVIAVIVALVLITIHMWQTNVDFKIGIISIWNNILNFFGRVPLFFLAVGNGILDSFSYAKVGMMAILDAMVNGAIDRINKLIDIANKIPGVSISALDNVSFGAETAVEEAAARAERAADLAEKQSEAAAKATERDQELRKDAAQWRAEAAAKKEKAQEDQNAVNAYEDKISPSSVEVSGGKIDQVGSIGREVDISNQSLEYMRDIAELEVLGGISSTMDYAQRDSLRLSQEDADLMRQSANSDTNVYYIQYQGGVKIQNDMRKGENWESIKHDLFNQSQHEIDTGISGIEEVMYA